MTNPESKQPKRSLRKRIVNSLKSGGGSGGGKKDDTSRNHEAHEETGTNQNGGGNGTNLYAHNTNGTAAAAAAGSNGDHEVNHRPHHRGHRDDEDGNNSDSAASQGSSKKGSRRRGEGIVRRIRSLSRSRSRTKNSDGSDGGSSGGGGDRSKTIVTVTSCRSDGYYNQKAPGSTSKLPRKAPTNLKLFHELAVGVKDAYAAVGETPTKPVLETDEETGHPNMSEKDFQARNVLWEFIGNIDFVRTSRCALLDEPIAPTGHVGRILISIDWHSILSLSLMLTLFISLLLYFSCLFVVLWIHSCWHW